MVNKKLNRTIYIALTAILLFGWHPAGMVSAQEEKAPPKKTLKEEIGEGYITMNFKDVDLSVFIKFISEVTGKSFLVDPAVKGPVTILSPKKVTIDEAYKVFLSVLEVHGFTIVPAGEITKIVPSAEARSKGVETFQKQQKVRPVDRIITQLIPLEHGDVSEMAKLLMPLIPKTGLLIPYPETNTLIVIDVESNINRLLYILGELDVKGDEEISILFIDYANAEDVAKMLLSLFQEKGKKGAKGANIKIISDKRTNGIIIRADSKTTGEIVRLITALDKKEPKPKENIHVYALENAVAEDVVKVLSEIPGKGAKDKEGKAAIISKDVQISADKATNSLVIISDPDEYTILKGIIKQLDLPRTMVYVEALIMEVSNSKSLDLGVEWRLGGSYRSGYGEGSRGGLWLGTSTGSNNLLGDLAEGALTSGFSAGLIGRAITLGGRTFPSIGAFIRAVRNDSDFNIISTPQILTLNNEEATIEVGQTLPFVTSIDQATSTDTERVQTYEYKDVGITLKVTPHINRRGFIRLEIEQSVRSVLNTTALGGTVLAPTTTFREAKTTISVMDGQTAVIGGLIEDRGNKGRTEVPLLADIPILGWLFTDTSDRDEKINLMVFLTPHIIKNPEDATRLRKTKEEEIGGGITTEQSVPPESEKEDPQKIMGTWERLN
ncbi:type II secretion system secretin GspD [Thermodesulfobacteriota bacterium]